MVKRFLLAGLFAIAIAGCGGGGGGSTISGGGSGGGGSGGGGSGPVAPTYIWYFASEYSTQKTGLQINCNATQGSDVGGTYMRIVCNNNFGETVKDEKIYKDLFQNTGTGYVRVCVSESLCDTKTFPVDINFQ